MSFLLEARGLTRIFAVRRGPLRRRVGGIRAVDDVDLALGGGETYALVGESGCGKTTLARCLLRLVEPTSGSVRFRGDELTELSSREMRRRRRFLQMVFQDPGGSLNPRMRVAAIVGEPLRAHGVGERADRPARIDRLLERVELDPALRSRYPHQLSGGQRQRVAIARALAPGPELVVADEPLSALDVSVQARILALLADLRRELDLTLLLISHDLAVVERLAARVGVMYLGRIVEEAPAGRLFAAPHHPYTAALLSAVPRPDPGRGDRGRLVLAGEAPKALTPPVGCAFHPRCPIASERCGRERPALRARSDGEGRVACHHPGESSPDRAIQPAR